MSCESDVGVHYSSESIEFSTLHLSSRNRLSNPSQSPDYLMMNSHLKSLPAISNSIQDQQQDLPTSSIKVVSANLSNSRSYYNRRTSPHAVLGKQHFHLIYHTAAKEQFLFKNSIFVIQIQIQNKEFELVNLNIKDFSNLSFWTKSLVLPQCV